MKVLRCGKRKKKGKERKERKEKPEEDVVEPERKIHGVDLQRNIGGSN